MNKNVEIEYSILQCQIIDEKTWIEKKIMHINKKDSNEPPYHSRYFHSIEKYLEWLNDNIHQSQGNLTSKFNIQMKITKKRKTIFETSSTIETIFKELIVYNKIDNSFFQIKDFSTSEKLAEIIHSNLEKKNEHSNLTYMQGIEFLQKLNWSSEQIRDIFRALLLNGAFENVVGGISFFSLNSLKKQIFSKELSIAVIPHEFLDDEGVKQQKEYIYCNGKLNKMLSLNQNCFLSKYNIGGYTVIDEFRKKKIEIPNIIFQTRHLETIEGQTSAFSLLNHQIDNSGNLTFMVKIIGTNDKYVCSVNIIKFLNSLVFIEKNNFYQIVL
ncbi:metallopeptidase TldD-related protein [Bacillus thuringiensis]